MSRKTMALAVAIAAGLLAACAGRYGSNTATNGSSFTLPNMPDFKITATYPNNAGTGTIMEELPSEGLGTVADPFWKATLGGYTQQQFSQALGFPPGTKLTIMNISKNISHTLNVVKKIKGPPADFPQSPQLSMSPSGGKLQKGYASGVISPGKTVSVTLGKAGIYLIGCYFHYHSGMQDVLVVRKGATPGPQATAPAH
jgi:plastocyanin